jgi:hypothetical protein
MYYVLMLRCWQLVWILVRIDHPCLSVGCHIHWITSPTPGLAIIAANGPRATSLATLRPYYREHESERPSSKATPQRQRAPLDIHGVCQMASFGYGDLRLVSPGLPYGRAPWAHNCKPIVGPKKEKGSCSFLSFRWPRCYGWMASSRWIGEDQAGMSLSEAISSGMRKGSHILRGYLFKLQLFKKLLQPFAVEKLTFLKAVY